MISPNHLTMLTTTCWSPILLLMVYLTSLCGGRPPFCKSDDSAWRSATSCHTGCSCQLACHREHAWTSSIEHLYWTSMDHTSRGPLIDALQPGCQTYTVNTWTTRRWRSSRAGRKSAACSCSSTSSFIRRLMSAWWWTAVRRKSCCYQGPVTTRQP